MAEATTTTDHDTIRTWVEARDGRPARVRDTGEGGILRFDFPGGAGQDSLEPITWEEWFDVFDQRGLALLHQDTKADGEQSTFFKLVNR